MQLRMIGRRVPQRVDDHRGRPGPGQRLVGPRRAGTRWWPTCPRPPAARPAGRAHRQLPHAVGGHGRGRPGAGRRRPRPHAARGRSARRALDPVFTAVDPATGRPGRGRRCERPGPSRRRSPTGRWPSSRPPSLVERVRRPAARRPAGAPACSTSPVAVLAGAAGQGPGVRLGGGGRAGRHRRPSTPTAGGPSTWPSPAPPAGCGWCRPSPCPPAWRPRPPGRAPLRCHDGPRARRR